MRKVYAISDLHLSFSTSKPMDIFGNQWENYWEKIVEDWESRVNDDDIVLIPGDISWAMNIDEAKADIDHIRVLKGTKVILRGNHDYWWSSYSKVKSILDERFIALQNNAIDLGGVIVCGSRGWTVGSSDDDRKIFNRELLRMKLSLDAMDKMRHDNDKVIVMTHYPPFNVNLSNNEMTDLISRYNVDAVVYGHLHGKDCRAEKLVVKGKTSYYLASCDLVGNKLVEIT